MKFEGLYLQDLIEKETVVRILFIYLFIFILQTCEETARSRQFLLPAGVHDAISVMQKLMVWIENIQAEWKICAWRARQSVAQWLPSTLEGTAAAQLLTVGHFWKGKAGTAGPCGGGGYRPQSRHSLVRFCFYVYRLELNLGKLLWNYWGQNVSLDSVSFTKVGVVRATSDPPGSFAVWRHQWLDLDFKLSFQNRLNCSRIQDIKCSSIFHLEWVTTCLAKANRAVLEWLPRTGWGCSE